MIDHNRSILYGSLWIVGLLLLFYYFGSNPVSRLALILDSQITSGTVTDASYDVHEDSDGNPEESYYAEYTYFVSGKKYSNTTSSDFTELFSEDDEKPITIQVEYVPEYPSISRIKGLGDQTFFQWLGTTAIQLVFTFVFALPGIGMLMDGWKRRKQYLQTRADNPVSET